MIPKIIHFVWVGGAPLNDLANKCIESWKKYCPDYEIKRWDETNFDINQNRYCKEAYESKKWAFVSDYIRLKVLHDYGGVYMDTDVEVVKPIDKFLKFPAFSGFENDTMIPTGIIAAEKGNIWIKTMLHYYDDRPFVLPNGEFDYTTNVTAITECTREMYPNLILKNSIQHFDDVSFFTKDYFCPIDYNTKKLTLTENTHTIHHFAGSWVPKRSLFKVLKFRIRQSAVKCLKFFVGQKNFEKIKAKRKERKNRNSEKKLANSQTRRNNGN